MAPATNGRPARPPTVKDLIAQAGSFEFNSNIPFKHWTRAAETLYQEASLPLEASFALADDDYGRAFVMLYRHSVLVLEYLPTHPQSKDPESRKAFRPLSRRIDRVMKDLEQLKPVIEDTYKEWERMQPPPQAGDRAQAEAATSTPRTYNEFAARDPSLSGNAKVLDASENQELAVDLAQQELTRRDTVRRATRQAGIPQEETLMRRRAGRWDGWDAERSRHGDLDLQRQMEATRQSLQAAKQGRPYDDSTHSGSAQPVSHQYSYPSVARSRPVEYERTSSQSSIPPVSQPDRPPKERAPTPTRYDRPPPLPPQYPPHSQDLSSMQPKNGTPQIPQKLPLADYQPLVPSRPSVAPGPIAAPTLPKKERLTFKPGAYLENGDPIRSVFLPSKLRRTFLDIASDNTRAGLEMCGMLCGTPINNALFIRCLVIPDQKCTSDTCETENESALFDYCSKEDLMVMGWIHTHPTQTCFMSSRDLHTHAGYQVMMPESIAIVCAPKFTPSYGIFRLTNPPGLGHILDCNKTETFHPHSVSNLYRDAERPTGHVYETDKMPFHVEDLRTK